MEERVASNTNLPAFMMTGGRGLELLLSIYLFNDFIMKLKWDFN